MVDLNRRAFLAATAAAVAAPAFGRIGERHDFRSYGSLALEAEGPFEVGWIRVQMWPNTRMSDKVGKQLFGVFDTKNFDLFYDSKGSGWYARDLGRTIEVIVAGSPAVAADDIIESSRDFLAVPDFTEAHPYGFNGKRMMDQSPVGVFKVRPTRMSTIHLNRMPNTPFSQTFGVLELRRL